jgi:hypothetical protein
MKKTFVFSVLFVMMLLIGVSGWCDTNFNTGTSANSNINTNTSVNTNANTALSNSTSIQGQQQGQLQGQLQNQVANGEVTVVGDTQKVYANSWPSIGGAEGVSSGTASSIFGSLGMSNTEMYKKIVPQIQVVTALMKEEIISKETGTKIIDSLVEKMLKANKTQRLLGVFCESESKSLFNFLGLLSWDSFWTDGQKPFHRKTANSEVLTQ